MRSKTAKRIREQTSEIIRKEVREKANEMVKLANLPEHKPEDKTED